MLSLAGPAQNWGLVTRKKGGKHADWDRQKAVSAMLCFKKNGVTQKFYRMQIKLCCVFFQLASLVILQRKKTKPQRS